MEEPASKRPRTGSDSSVSVGDSNSKGNAQIRRRFEKYISSKSEIQDKELRDDFGAAYASLVPVINDFLRNRRLQLFQNADASLFYKVQTAEVAKKYEGLDQNHMMVLQEITQSGNKGIWLKIIRLKTRLAQYEISKILKNLEKRCLIKAVKSITSKNKKVYVLYDVIPAREHTGGPWYTDQEFDEEFVGFVGKWIKNVIKVNGSCSITELADMLKSAKISKIELSQEDLKSVIDMLIYEGEIEEFIHPEHSGVQLAGSSFYEKKWKLSSKINPNDFFTETPCGVCPVADDCAPGADISPTNCKYMDDW
eukprot:CAMPEP_0204846604 /NCGR_PEP_ID=MMETSP1347-20130617/2121_1 /ASSEMBLY_ACC=CAM_ASM_000690 /TAXON_ID=215587 /ORGANISM="Aplanochytrium stocchinoi, Strain GSBS06" /LENGTH=308 /DNA_ID=CAMNT_0051987245 /DNA_START=46 /DNA_END=969 /DNA_ORIENTATION=+